MSPYNPKEPEVKAFPPSNGSSVLRPVEPWEIPMYGRHCIVTYRGGEQKKAVFRTFGTDFEEFENGPGMFPVAVVELENGMLDSVYVNQVQFTDVKKTGGEENAETDH